MLAEEGSEDTKIFHHRGAEDTKGRGEEQILIWWVEGELRSKAEGGLQLAFGVDGLPFGRSTDLTPSSGPFRLFAISASLW
jgi:hypothetical protein